VEVDVVVRGQGDLEQVGGSPAIQASAILVGQGPDLGRAAATRKGVAGAVDGEAQVLLGREEVHIEAGPSCDVACVQETASRQGISQHLCTVRINLREAALHDCTIIC
jgi:hypothetical protein